jgi:hypothetical protein
MVMAEEADAAAQLNDFVLTEQSYPHMMKNQFYSLPMACDISKSMCGISVIYDMLKK